MFTLHGDGVGAGIAIGKAHVIHQPGQNVPQYIIPVAQTNAEIVRIEKAIDRAIAELHTVQQLNKEQNREVLSIIDVHIAILEDALFLREIGKLIKQYCINAEDALSRYNKKIMQSFSQMDDPYLQDKSIDVGQVIDRVQGQLQKEDKAVIPVLKENYDNKIIIAHDLSPADTIAFAKHKISAFVTSLGGPTSHTAILAKSMQIPAIVGLHDAIQYIRTGDLLIIDGKRGVVLTNADQHIINFYKERHEKIHRRNENLTILTEAKSITLDSVPISITGNIEFEEQLDLAIKNGAAGVGLYRTEFLFMDIADPPNEQQQYETYSSILKKTSHTVSIRTLDLGSDKRVDGGRSGSAIKVNPALGKRGIRLCLNELDLFKPQLRAIFRAATNGDARIIIPMLSNVDELKQLFSLIEDIKRELTEEKISFNSEVPIGAMIEIPAAAIVAHIFATYFDFFSIGTNDLIQYTLAIDRVDDEVNYLYDPLHPAVLQLIKITVDAAKTADIPVSMCGEMAGNIKFTRLLLGMGLTDFSMDASALLQVKQQIRLTDTRKIKPLIEKILVSEDTNEIKSLVNALNA